LNTVPYLKLQYTQFLILLALLLSHIEMINYANIISYYIQLIIFCVLIAFYIPKYKTVTVVSASYIEMM
jgi:hypothetical protein